jgi:SAM-dependent methyltransferase
MNFQKFYEKYHSNRKIPKRIIGPKNFTYRHILTTLNKYCKTKDVLDVGSGVGTVDFYLASQGKRVTGIEISQKAFNVAQLSAKKFGLEKNIIFKRQDFLKTKLNKKFSFIICSEVLEHMPDDRKALNKIRNTLQKDGLLLLSVPSTKTLLAKIGALNKFDKSSGHLRRYSMEDITKLLTDTGFEPIFKAKKEGIIRYSLFVFKWGNPIIHAANKFAVISDVITFFDNISAILFGEADNIIV